MIYAFMYGAILALGLIAPLGIQNIFIFNQGANQRHFLHAMPSVFTAIFCDSILIICAVLGVSTVVLAIPWLKTTIFIIGFFFLTYMGWSTWHSQPNTLRAKEKPLSAKKQMIFAASVSLLNPHALIDSICVIGTNSLQFTGKEKLIFTSSCIFISACWFFSLSILGHFLHKIDKTGRWLVRINKLSAMIVWAIALYLAWLVIT